MNKVRITLAKALPENKVGSLYILHNEAYMLVNAGWSGSGDNRNIILVNLRTGCTTSEEGVVVADSDLPYITDTQWRHLYGSVAPVLLPFGGAITLEDNDGMA